MNSRPGFFFFAAALLVSAACSSSSTPGPSSSGSSGEPSNGSSSGSSGSSSGASGSSGSSGSSSGTSGSSGTPEVPVADDGELGDSCPCANTPGSGVPCKDVGKGSGCGAGLTCFGVVSFDGKNAHNEAKCTQTCQADGTLQGSCPSGFVCAHFILAEVDYGRWCDQ